MNRPSLLLRLLLPAFAICATAVAQTSANPSLTIDQQSQQASLVFSGVVTGVNVSDSGPIAQITFQVKEGLRGVVPGETVSIREWTGGWNGQTRYRLGEKVLVFLHAAEPNGFTSPIGGASGIYRFTNDSTLKLTEIQRSAVLRSPRLRGTLAETSASQPSKAVPAKEFLHALRLVLGSP